MSEVFLMELVSTAVAAWIQMVALFAAGCCGLRMCRAMLRCKTDTDLRREAVTAVMKQESFSCLNSRQRAAVFLALSACGTRRAG